MNKGQRRGTCILWAAVVFAFLMHTTPFAHAAMTNCGLDWNGDGFIDQADYLTGSPIGGFYAEWYIFQYYSSYYPILFPAGNTALLDYNSDGLVDQDDLMGTLDATAESEGFYVEWYIFRFYPGYYSIFMGEKDCANPPHIPCDAANVDPYTGLCWYPLLDTEGNSLRVDWETANANCDDLVANNHNDWRLPTIDEHRANLHEECEATFAGGTCVVQEDCSFYSPFDASCTTSCLDYDSCMTPYFEDLCEPCNWLWPLPKWNIPLGPEEYASQYWSSTPGEKYGAFYAYWALGYDNGFLALHTYGKAVACVRQEQPKDNGAFYQELPPDTDKGCDGSNAICSYLKGADFGTGTDLLGYYFDGSSCVEARGDIQTDDHCLFATDVDCAKSCAQSGECTSRRLRAGLSSNFWGGPDGYDPDNPHIYIDADEDADIGGLSICIQEGRVNDIWPIYQDPMLDNGASPRCNEGFTERRLADARPENSHLWDYLDLDAFEWEKICTYTLLTWIELLDGYGIN